MFTLLFLLPIVTGFVAALVGLALSYVVAARCEAPIERTDDAQEWADALSLELDVDAEWTRLADAYIAPRPRIAPVVRRPRRRPGYSQRAMVTTTYTMRTRGARAVPVYARQVTCHLHVAMVQ